MLSLEAIDQVTLAQELTNRGKLDAVGGPAYLSRLAYVVPTSVHARHYAEIVQRESFRRKLISRGGEISAIGYEGKGEPIEMLSEGQGKLLGLRPKGRRLLLSPKERAEVALSDMNQRWNGQSCAIPSGLKDLDNETGGLMAGWLVIVGARPGLGKSTLLQQVATNVADRGLPVLWCSAEMNEQQFNDREIVMETGIPIEALQNGDLSREQKEMVQEAIQKMTERPLYFAGGYKMTTVEIEARAKETEIEHGLALVVVDYIQLIGDNYGSSNNERVGYISQRLKHLALDLNVPVLAASQLNRDVESREDKRPLLCDLRDSGSLEQDADVVLFLHREDAYETEETWAESRKGKRGQPYPKNIAEMIMSKHRQYGRNAVIEVVWREGYRKYADMARKGT